MNIDTFLDHNILIFYGALIVVIFTISLNFLIRFFRIKDKNHNEN